MLCGLIVAQAQHVRLERDPEPLRALVTDLRQAPTEATQRVPRPGVCLEGLDHGVGHLVEMTAPNDQGRDIVMSCHQQALSSSLAIHFHFASIPIKKRLDAPKALPLPTSTPRRRQRCGPRESNSRCLTSIW